MLFSVFENIRSSGVQLIAVTAPENAGGFTSLRQDETSITLQWDQVNDNVSFILQYNGVQLNVAAPAGSGPHYLTVPNLTAGTRYLFTLFSVFENVRSSGVSIAAVTAPENAEGFRASEQNETSITLQWNKVNNSISFVLQFNGTETNISAPDGDGPVNHTVTSLSAGTKYTFMLFSVFENIRSSGVQLTAVTDPKNAEAVRASEQTETSITLQWNKVNSNVSFVLQFNGTETNISTPDGDGPVNYTISSLTAGTKYTFMLFSVFENIRSSGVQLTAVTAPENAGGFTSLKQDETSITLQWDQVNDNVSFILQYNEMQLNVAAPAGGGSLALTVPNLTAGTRYLFTLFSVFENVRSSGVSIAAVTAPENAEGFRASEQNETSITLQWNKVNNSISFVLQFNGTETHISAPDGDGPVNHTVSSLTAGTKYTFILYHVFMNVRSSAVNITVATAPQNAKDFRAIEQDETSITLRWNKVNNNVSFILQFNGTETFFSAPDGDGPVTHTVPSLTAGAIYTFTLFSVFENVKSSGEQLIAVTAPKNAEAVRASEQTETSITLQWNKVSSNTSFVLQFNGTETNISAPDGDGPVYHTVTSLSAGTKYTFMLFSVFENIRSSGVQLTAVTAPKNAEAVTASEQTETSITLQWNKVNSNVSFVLQFNGTETNISTPDGDGPVNYTISSLTAGTKYTFMLFSVFENIRSSGVQLTAVTAPENAGGFTSLRQDETSITLQWDQVNDNVSFILQYNEMQLNVAAPAGSGPLALTVTNLTAGTRYLFTLFSVFENVRSSGVSIAAVTAPENAEGFRASEQNETSITLQWNKVNNSISFVLQFNGTETNISAPDGDGPVNHTVTSLSAGTKHTFMLFSVFENIRSSGVQLTAVTAPKNAGGFTSLRQDETSITLQWEQVNDNVSFILQYNEMQLNVAAQAGGGSLALTVTNLTAGTRYLFTLFSVFENVRSSGVSIAAVTAPENAEGFRASEQTETSITLQWNKVSRNTSFVLQFNGTETNIRAPDGDGPVNHTVTSLSAGTKYTFMLFSVFENIRSSGVQLTAVTDPKNAEAVRTSEQTETSITLQWNKVNSNISFVLRFNGTETNISTPDGDGPVNYTISSLTAGTKYTFMLFSVFENIRSSGVQLTAVTAPENAGGFISLRQDETSITLQWDQVNDNVSFILQYNEMQLNAGPPAGSGPHSLTVPNLTAGTRYLFTLFSVFENVRSSGVSIAAVTAPENAEGFRASEQNETSITLQWNKVNNSISFVLQFNGTETHISAPDGDGPVNHTVSSLTAGTKYTFILYHVFMNVRSSTVNITVATAPQNAKDFRAIEQDETSITLRWNKVNNNVSFILQFNGTETFFSAPDGDGTVTHTVSSLTAGAIYTFRLFSVFENIRSSGEQLIAVTAPQTAEGFKPSAQNDTSITLQWNKVNNNISFVLQFDGIERPISAPVGDGLVRYTITSLTAGTKYTFTLFSAYENVRSSGISIVTVTAPSDAKGFRPSAQNETSITLKWNKVSSNTSFVLQFNGTETNISAPTGDGPVTHTVSSLTARTNYTFTLFSVFENIRSSGVTIPAATGPNYVLAITMRVERPSTTSEFEMEDALVELLRKYNLPPQASLKVVSSKP
ncbi:tenascin-X [Fundulus heteroclitus]|uniref:tenascin-X n=1 Tax=Fundulus heteroclitus TaxID=8078 RepID=UPI00165B23A5|nr:tenascin-X [Fundulus heteroclitus]